MIFRYLEMIRTFSNFSFPDYEVTIQAITDSNMDTDAMSGSFFLYETKIRYSAEIVWELIFNDIPDDNHIVNILKKLDRERKINSLFDA